MRVLALTKYDREAASTRQRVLQFRPALEQAGITLDHRPLLGDSYVRSLATGERWSRLQVVGSYLRRIGDLLARPDADLIWVYADLFPYLPAGFDRLLFRRGIPVVYDCDDAFFLSYNCNANPIVRALLSGKIEKLMARASAVVCGNEFLRNHAARFAARTIVIPTSVDTDIYTPAPREARSKPVIGWIGSPSTWPNVRPLLPLLRELCASGSASFHVVGARRGAAADAFDGMETADWSEATEVDQVRGFDIGIMPLIDGAWARGKSGYKLIQYMACGVPAVASPVGANAAILTRETGLLASGEDEWRDALTTLLNKPELRHKMGNAGRARTVELYSVQTNAPRLIDLFRELTS